MARNAVDPDLYHYYRCMCFQDSIYTVRRMVCTKVRYDQNVCHRRAGIGVSQYSDIKVIELSGGNLFVTIMGVVLGWSIAYNLIWAVISGLWSSYFETEVRYSGISFVYHVPSFLVAGLVPTICTLLIDYGKEYHLCRNLFHHCRFDQCGLCHCFKIRHDRGMK